MGIVDIALRFTSDEVTCSPHGLQHFEHVAGIEFIEPIGVAIYNLSTGKFLEKKTIQSRRAQAKNLGVFGWPVLIARENRVRVGLLVIRGERRLIAPFFLELRRAFARAFARAEFDFGTMRATTFN